jgi:hypothetical protein
MIPPIANGGQASRCHVSVTLRTTGFNLPMTNLSRDFHSRSPAQKPAALRYLASRQTPQQPSSLPRNQLFEIGNLKCREAGGDATSVETRRQSIVIRMGRSVQKVAEATLGSSCLRLSEVGRGPPPTL